MRYNNNSRVDNWLDRQNFLVFISICYGITIIAAIVFCTIMFIIINVFFGGLE